MVNQPGKAQSMQPDGQQKLWMGTGIQIPGRDTALLLQRMMKGPWWMVDLQSEYVITSIQITNRDSYCKMINPICIHIRFFWLSM